jgi:hypothetical protein
MSIEKILGENFDSYLDSLIEEFEQIDELSKKTLGNYIKRASDKGMTSAFFKDIKMASKRLRGIKKATDKLTRT